MPEPYKVVHLIHEKEPFLKVLGTEIRYTDGYRFLDRCGMFLNWLTKLGSEWVIPNTPTPQGAHAFNLRTGAAVMLGSSSSSFSLDRSEDIEEIKPDEAAQFAADAEIILDRVIREFEIQTFSRFGFQQTYWCFSDSIAETEAWIRGLGWMPKSDAKLYEAFGAEPFAASCAIMMTAEECRYRIAATGHERPVGVPVGPSQQVNVLLSGAKQERRRVLAEIEKKRSRIKAAKYFASLDLDAFLLDPKDLSISPFIKTHLAEFLPRLRQSIQATEQEVGNGN